jgi:biotin transporter BioY
VVIGAFREQIQTGWAMIIWPIVIAVVSMYALGLKFLAVDRYTPQTERTSQALLTILVLVAVALGLSVKQWLD